MKLAIVFLCGLMLGGPLLMAQAQEHFLTTSEAPMKDLLAQGFEIRSHQFYRCTANPAADAALSCVNVVMQKGPQFASCSFDRNRWLLAPGSMNATCVLFR